MKLCLFRTVPLSIIRSFSLYTQQWYMSYRFADSLRAGLGCSILIPLTSCQQTCMTYTIALCAETWRVSFWKEIREINASSWFITRKLFSYFCLGPRSNQISVQHIDGDCSRDCTAKTKRSSRVCWWGMILSLFPVPLRDCLFSALFP